MRLLECNSLCLGYPGHLLASNLSFTLDAGQCLCVIGENGVGKSTLVRTLLHLQPALDGTIQLGQGITPQEIGYLPQATAISADFPATVQEVVLSGCLASRGWCPFYGRKERELAHQQLTRLGLAELCRRSFRELSGGQRQRTLLARALCAAKSLLLLDEPVAGLDPAIQAEFYRLIRKLREEDGMGIIMVSHDLHGAIQEATHVLHLSTTTFYGTREEYLASPQGRRFTGGAEQ